MIHQSFSLLIKSVKTYNLSLYHCFLDLKQLTSLYAFCNNLDYNVYRKILVGFEGFYEGQAIRARLCCRKISDSIFWLYYFTPR